MAGTTQATAPAAGDKASTDASTSSPAGARHASDHRPARPDYNAMMEESLAKELGDAEDGGKGGDKGTQKEDKTGTSKGQRSTVKGQRSEKADGEGSKKLNLEDDDDEDDDGSDEDDDEEDELTKAAKAKLKEGEESEEEDETEQETEDEPEQETDTEEKDEEEQDEDKAKGKKPAVPKGMEGWPPAAIERFQRQDAQVKGLQRQLAIEGITIAPTADSPFAHLEKAEDLETLISQAKSWKKKCSEIPEGGEVKLGNGQTKELTKEEVASRLQWAEGVLDVDAVSEARERLKYRTTNKPWEAAARLVPDLFDRKSENFRAFASVMQQVPQLRKLEDYEYFVACALKGLQQDGEEQSGVAQYVRVEMKDGKPVFKKKPGSDKEKGKKKAPPPAPNDTRTALKSKAGKADVSGAEQRAAKSRSPEDLAKLVEAELAA